MSLRIKQYGVRVVQDKLNRAIVYIRPGFDRETAYDILNHLFRTMPGYPPELPGQTYERTYNLERALRSKVGEHPMALSEVRAIGSQQVVILGLKGGSESLYGPEVVGFSMQQRAIHRGRWFTLMEHVQRRLKSIVGIVRSGVRRTMRKAGFH